MASAPLLLDHLDAEDAEHFAEVRALLDAAGVAYEIDAHARARPRLLHAHRLRVHLRRARRAERRRRRRPLRRPRRAARRRRRRPAIGWAAGVERILLARRGAPRARAASATSSSRSPATPDRARRRRSRWPPRRGAPGVPAQLDLGRALAQGPAQAGRPPAAPRTLPSSATRAIELKDMESGEQEPVDERRPAVRRARCCAGRHARDAAPPTRQRLPRHLVRVARRRPRRRARSRVAGWVHRRRDHGGLIFIDLRDRTGLVQLVFHPETRGARLRARRARCAPRTSSQRRGHGRRAASEGNVNPNLPTGEIEVSVAELELLADAARRRRSRSTRTRRVDETTAPALPLPRPAPRRACATR